MRHSTFNTTSIKKASLGIMLAIFVGVPIIAVDLYAMSPNQARQLGSSSGRSAVGNIPSLGSDPNSAQIPQGSNSSSTTATDFSSSIQNKCNDPSTPGYPDVPGCTETSNADSQNFFIVNDSSSNIDPSTDPRFEGLRNAAVASQQMQAQNFQGCVDLQTTTSGAPDNRTCYGAGTRNYSQPVCTVPLEVTCTSGLTGDDNCPINQNGILTNLQTQNQTTGGSWPVIYNASTGIYQFGDTNGTSGQPRQNNLSGDCNERIRIVTFDISETRMVKTFALKRMFYDDWGLLRINGQLVYVGPQSGDQLTRGGTYDCNILGFNCEHRMYYTSSDWGQCEQSGTTDDDNLMIDLLPYLQNGTNTIEMRVFVDGGGNAYFELLTAAFCDCAGADNWNDTPAFTVVTFEDQNAGTTYDRQTQFQCDPPTYIPDQRYLYTTTCTAPDEWRTIDGLPVYRSCWEEEHTYNQPTAMTYTEDADCLQYQANGCALTNQTCSGPGIDGYCYQLQYTYDCATRVAGRTVQVCTPIECTDGSCEQQATGDGSADFGKAASEFEAAKAAAGDIASQCETQNCQNTGDVSQINVFTGQAMQCANIPSLDCCNFDDILNGILGCSTEEDNLAIAYSTGRVHRVGNYGSACIPLIGCITDNEVYCAFPSKIGRLVIEGAQQQGVIAGGWGTAQSPNCSGLTIAEMQSLDFAQIDFSEFYADAVARANTAGTAIPSQTDFNNMIAAQLGNTTGSSQGVNQEAWTQAPMKRNY